VKKTTPISPPARKFAIQIPPPAQKPKISILSPALVRQNSDDKKTGAREKAETPILPPAQKVVAPTRKLQPQDFERKVVRSPILPPPSLFSNYIPSTERLAKLLQTNKTTNSINARNAEENDCARCIDWGMKCDGANPQCGNCRSALVPWSAREKTPRPTFGSGDKKEITREVQIEKDQKRKHERNHIDEEKEVAF
jgi:hypothetical protein